MQRLGDHGASVAHNPGSNMRLGNGLADVRGMLERKVNVGIGTDGANCSDNLNMYESMRLASMVSKTQGPDTDRWLTTGEVLAAATEGSARALGFGDKLGRIAPGYKADIVFLDLHNVNWLPFNNAVNQLVHTEDGSAVHSVMVGGRMVVEDRRVVGVDMAALARRVEDARARLEEATAAEQAAVRARRARRQQLLPRACEDAVSRRPLRRAGITGMSMRLGCTARDFGGKIAARPG